MYIFNTTFHIEDAVLDRFLDFLKQTYIPKTKETEHLRNPKLFRVISQHAGAGSNYSLQFEVDNLTVFNKWISGEGELLNKLIATQFEHHVAGFITMLEHVEVK